MRAPPIVVLLAALAGLLQLLASSETKAQPSPARPIVVVPGILGTKLCHGRNVVWGGISSLSNFGRLDTDQPTAETLVPCGLLDKISVLGPFWKIDAYQGLIDTLKRMGYREGETLFVFTYDWRRSNLETAHALGAFINTIPAPKVDVVAHSMGGLLLTIYLQQQGGTQRVNKTVFLGTPFMGSMNAFAGCPKAGAALKTRLPGEFAQSGGPLSRLLPSTSYYPGYSSCCGFGTRDNYTAVDPFDPLSWRKLGWLPPEYDTGPRAPLFDARLAGAKKVRDIMARPFPAEVGSVKIVGDAFGTNLYLLTPSPIHPGRIRPWSGSRRRNGAGVERG